MKTKKLLFILLLPFFACGEPEKKDSRDIEPATETSATQSHDKEITSGNETVPDPEPVVKDNTPADPVKPKEPVKPEDPVKPKEPAEPKEPVKPTDPSKKYSNEIFRNVSVRTTAENTFRVTGQARVFEASFSWVVEDGHNQLKKGHNMTDAGAPEWGNFDFTIKLDKKPDPHTVPHLILFIHSAKDGSVQHELPIPLRG